MFNLYNFKQKKFTLIILSLFTLIALTHLVKHFFPIPIYEKPKISGEFKPVFYKPDTDFKDIENPKPPSRNIFSSLQFTQQKNKSPKTVSALPVLKGISYNNNMRNAIIEYAGESKTMNLSEYIGSYQLIEITSDSVVLTYNGQKLYLHLGGNNK